MEYYSIIASKNYMCRHIYTHTHIYIYIHIFNPLSSPPGVRRFNIFLFTTRQKNALTEKIHSSS